METAISSLDTQTSVSKPQNKQLKKRLPTFVEPKPGANEYALSYPESLKIIGGLSNTSKMPWYSWSTSAYDCPTGSLLREVEGSVCSDCYACKGCYVFSSVRNAHKLRLAALGDPRFVEAFVVVLTSLYERGRKTYLCDGKPVKENRFRWHDAGDLQSVDHMRMVNDIALRTPFIDHWIPTKEAKIVSDFLKQGGEIAPNLTVRVSHPMKGQTFKKRPNGLPFSTVGVENSTQQCPAYSQGGKCLDCKNCWVASIDFINYPLH